MLGELRWGSSGLKMCVCVLPFEAKLFDSPGLLNQHQITTRLMTRVEEKLVQISEKLKPRTHMIKILFKLFSYNNYHRSPKLRLGTIFFRNNNLT